MDSTIDCSRCGTALRGGRFCAECGTPAQGFAATNCPACGSAAPRAARFCPTCGRSLAGSAPNGIRIPLILGALAVVALLTALFVTERKSRLGVPASSAEGFSSAPAPAGTPPDLSTMTPRERFDRLYNRVMEASESGDAASVTRFTPMALAAYGMLEQVDADARYHAAMIHLHTGDPTGAAALADSILAENPAHLLGLVIRGTVARFQRDAAGEAAAHKAFATGYQAEVAAGRPEYREHQRMIDRFRDESRGGGAVP